MSQGEIRVSIPCSALMFLICLVFLGRICFETHDNSAKHKTCKQLVLESQNMNEGINYQTNELTVNGQNCFF